MKKKLLIIALIAITGTTLAFMSHTYARYLAEGKTNVNANVATWKILIDDNDITTEESKTIELNPNIIEDENTNANKLAPDSKGYIDVQIDPSHVSLSYEYTIDILQINENIPDLTVNKYEILNSDSGLINITDQKITNRVIKNDNLPHEPFTIRLHFEWYDGEENQTEDKQDTETSYQYDELIIKLNMSFNQIIS